MKEKVHCGQDIKKMNIFVSNWAEDRHRFIPTALVLSSAQQENKDCGQKAILIKRFSAQFFYFLRSDKRIKQNQIRKEKNKEYFTQYFFFFLKMHSSGKTTRFITGQRNRRSCTNVWLSVYVYYHLPASS